VAAFDAVICVLFVKMPLLDDYFLDMMKKRLFCTLVMFKGE